VVLAEGEDLETNLLWIWTYSRFRLDARVFQVSRHLNCRMNAIRSHLLLVRAAKDLLEGLDIQPSAWPANP
jgi:hypothetical protein